MMTQASLTILEFNGTTSYTYDKFGRLMQIQGSGGQNDTLNQKFIYMNIGLMRKLDFWVGVPLCFLCSGLDFIPKLIRGRKEETKIVRNPLFIKPSEMGAIILAYPLLRQIKKEYSPARIFFITFQENRDAFKLMNDVVDADNIFLIRNDNLLHFVCDTLRVIGRMRKEKIDVIFDLEFFSRFSALLTYLIPSGKKIGFHKYTFEGLYRGNFFTHKVQFNPLTHISKTYLSLLQVVKSDRKDTPELDENIDGEDLIFPDYLSKKEPRESLESKLKSRSINNWKRLFLLNPGEGILPLREWPLENFIAVSGKILQEAGNYMVIVGRKTSAQKAGLIMEALNNQKCIDLTGETNIEELMELFNMADALISNDCGLAHLAMLTPIKEFIIFGPESPEIFRPLKKDVNIIYSNWPCSPCLSAFNHRDSDCRDNKCLKAIGPNDVYELVKKSLG
jgi:ADP-heptose:LPS heptosyltransferase